VSEALIFTQMKAEIEAIVKKYGEENSPPPWSVFTMPNAVGEGNMHVVQKVFEGPFEVRIWTVRLNAHSHADESG
jgi:mannosyl-oligosaccharide glucosidase